MIRTAIIKAGIVTNIVMHDPDAGWTPPDGASLLAADTANIGDRWDGTNFAPPAPTTEQMRAATIAQLSTIDAKSVRPLRAILEAQAAGLAPNAADVDMLADLNAQAAELRAALVT